LPPDKKTDMTILQAAGWGVASFRGIVGEVWRLKELRNFLISFFFYIDGVLTIIVMAGLVATETFGFDPQATIVLFLIVQVSALIGAFALAKPTDRYGPKKVLNGVIFLWVVVSISAFFVQDATVFYGLAVTAGLGLGSAQSASRAFMSSLIPEGKEAEMFGFYALCGKSSSVLGPTLFGTAAYLAGGNQRPGFLVLTAMFLIGLVLLQRVSDPTVAEG
jgi:UMF1 family MFS transporter